MKCLEFGRGFRFAGDILFQQVLRLFPELFEIGVERKTALGHSISFWEDPGSAPPRAI